MKKEETAFQNPYEAAMYIMLVQRQCVIQSAKCDRNCKECSLLQDPTDVYTAYTLVIDLLKYECWRRRK